MRMQYLLHGKTPLCSDKIEEFAHFVSLQYASAWEAYYRQHSNTSNVASLRQQLAHQCESSLLKLGHNKSSTFVLFVFRCNYRGDGDARPFDCCQYTELIDIGPMGVCLVMMVPSNESGIPAKTTERGISTGLQVVYRVNREYYVVGARFTCLNTL